MRRKKPDYDEIKRLEEELGFAEKPADPAVEHKKKLETVAHFGPGAKWLVNDPGDVNLYAASAIGPNYVPTPPKPRPTIYGPKGERLR